jgi:hypothetical protein
MDILHAQADAVLSAEHERAVRRAALVRSARETLQGLPSELRRARLAAVAPRVGLPAFVPLDNDEFEAHLRHHVVEVRVTAQWRARLAHRRCSGATSAACALAVACGCCQCFVRVPLTSWCCVCSRVYGGVCQGDVDAGRAGDPHDEHTGFRAAVLAIANSRSQSSAALRVFESSVGHWDRDVRLLALHAFGDRLPAAAVDRHLERVLASPHDSQVGYGRHTDGDFLHAALGILRRRRRAPDAVSRDLIDVLLSHVHTFAELHHGSTAGCFDMCPLRCAARLFTPSPVWLRVGHHCVEWCAVTCRHLDAYEAGVLAVLEQHGELLVSRARVCGSCGQCTWLFIRACGVAATASAQSHNSGDVQARAAQPTSPAVVRRAGCFREVLGRLRSRCRIQGQPRIRNRVRRSSAATLQRWVQRPRVCACVMLQKVRGIQQPPQHRRRLVRIVSGGSAWRRRLMCRST